jgi:hypothetical protein
VARTRQISGGRIGRADRAGRDVRTWRRWTAAAVAAGVVALGGMGAVWVVQEQRVDDARQATQQLQDAQARLGVIMAAGDARVRTANVPGGGTVTVAVSRSLDDGVVLMDDLPVPPAGKVYQLWLIEGTTPTSVGVMASGQRSGAATVESIGGADSIGVTLEPTGGSASPTFPILTGVSF